MRKQGTSSDHWIDAFYYWLEAQDSPGGQGGPTVDRGRQGSEARIVRNILSKQYSSFLLCRSGAGLSPHGELYEKGYVSKIKFRIEKTWKGSHQSEITLLSDYWLGTCVGFNFEVGKKYLVYAFQKQNIHLFRMRAEFATCVCFKEC